MTNHRTVMVAVLATVVGVAIILYLLGGILLAFGLSGIAAYTLLPVVKLAEGVMPWRQRHPGLAAPWPSRWLRWPCWGPSPER